MDGALAAGAAGECGEMGEYDFKLGMFLPELDLPFERALETAREMGAGFVWFSRLKDRAPVAEWSDREVDRVGRLVERHDLRWLVVSADNPFKSVHLTDLPLEGLAEHPLCWILPAIPSFAAIDTLRGAMMTKIYKRQDSIKNALQEAETMGQRLLDEDLARATRK